MKSHETKPTIFRCVHQSHEQKHMVAKSSFKHSFWRACVILPFFHTKFFIQKPFVDGRKFPGKRKMIQKVTKSHKKFTPTIVQLFPKNKQLQPLKMIPFRNRSKPRPTLRTRNRPSSVSSSSHHWEVKLLPLMRAMNPERSVGFRVSGSFQVKGIFRAFLISDPKIKINTSKL